MCVKLYSILCFFFFFQAEDGIRDLTVTGVQTCALPISVANTLTIFAIKDIGLAIAFPLWNANSLLGILWGTLLFNELRDAGAARRLGVWGGAAAMFAGATLPAVASSAQAPGGDALLGGAAAPRA